MRVAAALLICAALCGSALAQATIVLAPMNVDNFRLLQRVSRNAGWASTAYKNYMVGLFEGLLNAEGSSENNHSARLFCLPPPVRDSARLSDTFDWMETQLTNVVAKAESTDMVAKVFVAHLTKNFPCSR